MTDYEFIIYTFKKLCEHYLCGVSFCLPNCRDFVNLCSWMKLHCKFPGFKTYCFDGHYFIFTSLAAMQHELPLALARARIPEYYPDEWLKLSVWLHEQIMMEGGERDVSGI